MGMHVMSGGNWGNLPDRFDSMRFDAMRCDVMQCAGCLSLRGGELLVTSKLYVAVRTSVCGQFEIVETGDTQTKQLGVWFKLGHFMLGCSRFLDNHECGWMLQGS